SQGMPVTYYLETPIQILQSEPSWLFPGPTNQLLAHTLLLPSPLMRREALSPSLLKFVVTCSQEQSRENTISEASGLKLTSSRASTLMPIQTCGSRKRLSNT